MNIALWIVAGLLALVFLLAGVMKAILPVEQLKQQVPWTQDVPAPFVRLIGGAEVLAAIGLILPAVTGIASWLTEAAAGGLVIVMLSAAIFHSSRKEWSTIGGNAVLLLLAAFVVLGRWMLAPI
jgi:putative oxidoreductase